MRAQHKRLHTKTLVSKKQLAIIKSSVPGGEHLKYDKKLTQRKDKNGKVLAEGYQQSLSLTKRMVKLKRKAPKYILYSDQLGRRIYIADFKHVKGEETPVTFVKKEAMVFAHGLDNPQIKKEYYNSLTTLNLLTHDL